MLRLRHRRRRTGMLLAHDESPRWLVRIAIGALVLIIFWYLGKTFLSFFLDSSLELVSARLTVEDETTSAQVSLQGGELLRAENGLKLYEGDMVSTEFGGNVIVGFFDGTNIRLDTGTKIAITGNKKVTNGVSAVGVSLAEGKLWIQSPKAAAFTGSIARTIDLGIATVEIPSDTSGLLSRDTMFFTAAGGIGARVRLAFAQDKEFFLGEGQSFTLSQEARSALEAGGDPYAFRDPVTSALLESAFVQESTQALRSASLALVPSTSDDGPAPSDQEFIIVTNPEDGIIVESDTVIVSGKAHSRVKSIDVNGYAVNVGNDLTFSQELAMPDSNTVAISITARDEEGVTLAQTNRTVHRLREPPDPPGITSPGSSGDVITLNGTEVEIRGTAPARATGIIVNDYRLQLFKPGNPAWSYLASTKLDNLKNGENVFNVFAIDSAGNKSTPARITLVLGGGGQTGTGTPVPPSQPGNASLTPGILSVIKPAPGTSHETDQVEILIEGKTSTNTHSIEVNGYQLQLYEAGKDFWNYIASTELSTLRRGKNTYHVVARNEKGEILDELEYTITLNVRG